MYWHIFQTLQVVLHILWSPLLTHCHRKKRGKLPKRRRMYRYVLLFISHHLVNWDIGDTKCHASGNRQMIIFLPKFHCKLNFIEQCWGYAKRLYRMFPESSREDVLEKNALEALDAVPLESMRRWVHSHVELSIDLMMIWHQICKPFTAVHGCLPAWPQWETSCMGC